MNGKAWWLGFVVMAASACAEKQKTSMEEAFGPAKTAPKAGDTTGDTRSLPPEKWAQQFTKPADCVNGAREVERSAGHTSGWAAVKACMAMPGFTQLDEVISMWGADLRAKSDGPTLAAKIIANRGGAVHRDLALLASSKVPLATLDDALREPGSFTGKQVLVLGKVTSAVAKKKKLELTVSEVQVPGDVAPGERTPFAGLTFHPEGADSVGISETGQTVVVTQAKGDGPVPRKRVVLMLMRFAGAKDVEGDEGGGDAEGTEAPVSSGTIAQGSLVSFFDIAANVTQ